MHDTPIDRAVEIVCENAEKPALATTEESLERFADFRLATKVEFALLAKGYHEEVTCRKGKATIAVDKFAMRQEHYESELKKAACEVPGVREAETKVGAGFRQPSIYPRLDEFDIPSKILLVDDEKEFVHTLSERLQTRRMESEIAYDGEQALAAVADEAPDVMILDLKMPGIDGIEVLRKVKREHPDVEVIILTGHGSEQEERLSQELGAFAYLQKPVDINVLTRTMKEAYKRTAERKGERPSSEK
jgi:CheY-like chemotaxis protein